MKPFQEVVDTFHSLAPVEFERSLIGVTYPPFATDGELLLLLRDQVAHLLLRGTHFWGTRQSMIGRQFRHSPSYEAREDWFVRYFDILDDSPFLTAFLDQQNGFVGQVILYDTKGQRAGSHPAQRPVHVALCCGGGWLDVDTQTVSLVLDAEMDKNRGL